MSSQTTAPAVPAEHRILRRAEVEAKTGFKRAHIYSLMKEGKFPRRCAWACAPWAGTRRRSSSGSPIASMSAPDAFPRYMPFNRERPMQVVSIISTKGGVGKTTTAANLGGFAADTGLRVLLLDLDVQPTLSSYFTLAERAPAGIYEMLAYNEQRAEQLVSRTAIERLDLVLSNDDRGELNTLLLHAPDGRLRLRLLPTLAPHYDLLLIDTRARSVLLEMAVLASNLALSPVTPEILGARAAARHAATHRGHRAVPPPRHRAAAAAPAHQPRASGVVECAADPAGAASGIPGAAWRARAGHRRAGD